MRLKTRTALVEQIYNLSPQNFDQIALDCFFYQYEHNILYRRFVDLLGKKPQEIQKLTDIPFLPISFFKTAEVKTGNWPAEMIFGSSGTGEQGRSRHFLRSTKFYENNAMRCFNSFYGPIEQYAILALLPSYLERNDSSLVFMARYFIQYSPYTVSGFFLNNIDALLEAIAECKSKKQPFILLGVSFALLDLAEKGKLELGDQAIVMETGGMKGRRKELLRSELHQILCSSFGIESIHSEYGMTELLSQAYSQGNGLFVCPPTMRILIRDSSDPFTIMGEGKNGGINIVDLANIDSCCFVASDDLGRYYTGGSFEVLGRFDASDIRGCNLLLEI